MSAFTSKATGNWSAAGQTTWNEVGIPGAGDTVTINSPHNVTVDVNTSVGDGSATVLSIAIGATLTVPANITLTVNGGIDNAGVIDMGDGAAISYLLVTDPPFVFLSQPSNHYYPTVVMV